MTSIVSKSFPAACCIALLVLTACGKKEAQQPAQQQTVQPAAGASPQAAPVSTAKTADELIGLARKAESENRTVSPANDNAIEYYLQVLGQEPTNERAVNALIDLFPLGATQAEQEIAARNVDEAQRVISLLDRANPDSYTVSTLKSKLNAARTQIQREEERKLAQEQEAARRQQEAQAAAQAPTQTPATTTAQTRPATTQTAPPPTPARTEPEPEPEPAAPVLPSREAVLVRTVRPDYPTQAARRRQEGWVEVQFTVGTDGKVADVKVVRAEPNRVFDREAIRAVQRWEFQPAIRDGQPAASTLTRRIEFKFGG